MRLAYFPEPQKDELLYSVLARFGRHLGLTASGAVAARLFGSRHVLATLDFPSRIADLAEQIARPLDLGAERIINQHTLLPYYETHQPPHRRQLARASMAGHGRSTHFRLGTAGFRVRPPSRLRFCPSCASYMLQTCGELYWRRAHQLPGVLVCPDHACVLREATFDMTSTSRQMYVAATLANCPANAASVLSETSPSIIERLRSVARASAALLDVPSAEEPCDVIERYRAKLATLGLMRSKRKVDVLALASAFSGFYEGVLPQLSIKAPSSSGSGYVAEMLRSRKAASSPLAHVLLDVFLEESTSSDVRRLAKPWVCFNPLADHTGLRVVTDFERRSHAGVVTGTFICSCGYTYRRRLEGEFAVGPPLFKSYGPLLEPALRRMLAIGATQRQIAKAVNLDAKTLNRQMVTLGLIPHSMVGKSGERSFQADGMSRTPAEQKRRGAGPAPFDWVRADAAFEKQLDAAAAEVLALKPSVRVTLAELGRRTGRSDWLRRTETRLPRSEARAEALIETVEQFRNRRIRAAISDMKKKKEVAIPAWQVMRSVGLNGSYLLRIKVALEEINDGLES